MTWKITFTNNAVKQLRNLSERVVLVTQLLKEDLAIKGPYPGNEWPNYGKLKGKQNQDKRHCHLIKGNPTYVCCWQVLDKRQKWIEVYYVGTHENAPY